MGTIYAVDFDGTLCKEDWPKIGKPNKGLIRWLIKQKRDGNALILWTMREGDDLQEAIDWCKENGLVFDAVNDNLQRMKDKYKNNPRKVYADVYIDDHNLRKDLWRDYEKPM